MGNPPVIVALLVVRVVVGVTMIRHGYNHWRGGGKIAGTARWFSGLGLKYGVLQAWMSVVTELGAGFLLIIGLLTPLAGAAIISVMLVAGLLAHRKNGFFVFKDGYEYVLLIAVVCLLLGALGPGHFSVDYAAGIQITGWAGAGIALGIAVVAVAGLLATFYRPAPKKPTSSGASSSGAASEASSGASSEQASA
ncbi:MAG TPA: DoxX family protein [Trebonia sp.]|nr:DoxX family protein [Trebonia sp.]